jgi:hypothetical protein
MAAHGLSPCFVQIKYRTFDAPHVMTLPLREWIPIAGGHPSGSFTAWDSTNVDADDMISGFATALAALLATDASVGSYVLWTQASPTDPSVFRVAAPLGITGGITPTTQIVRATQATYNYYDTDGFRAKLVTLDTPLEDFIPVQVYGSLPSAVRTLLASWTAENNAWSSRAGHRPATFTQATYTLNDRLRREYDLN